MAKETGSNVRNDLEPIKTKLSSYKPTAMVRDSTDGTDDLHASDLDEAQDASVWLNAALENVWNHVDDEDGDIEQEEIKGNRRSAKKFFTLDSRLSKLSTSMTITRQDTLATIDSTMSAVTSTMPRLVTELRLMRDAAQTLKLNIEKLREEAELAGVKERSSKANDVASANTAAAVLEKLAALSALHSRMTAAQNVLGLAESWSTLSTDVNAYLADAKYDVAASRLNKARSSLSVFERTPEFDGRKKLLDGLASAIESRLSPSLVDAIRDRDLGQAKRLLSVLLDIEQESRMFDVWRRTRSEECLKEWSRLTEGMEADRSENYVAGQLLGQLKGFADRVVALLSEERKIAVQVFSDTSSYESVTELTLLLVSSLTPDLASQFAAWLSKDGSNAILRAGEIHSALRYLASGISGVLRSCDVQRDGEMERQADHGNASHSALALSPEVKTQSIGMPLTWPTPAQQRRLSARRSSIGVTVKASPLEAQVAGQDDGIMSKASTQLERMSQWDKILLAIPNGPQWEQEIFSAFVETQLKYDFLERSHLAKELTTTNVTDTDAFIPSLGRIMQTLRLANDASLRTRKLTYGLACDELVASIDGHLAACINASKDAFDQQANAALERMQKRNSVSQGGIDQSDGADPSTAYLRSSSEISGDGQEWRSFENGMQLFSKLQSTAERVSQAEAAIAEQMSDLAELLLTPITSATQARESLLRFCTDSTGSSTTSMRLLLLASADRLRSGSLPVVLKRIRAITALTPARRRGSVTTTTASIDSLTSSLFQSFRSALLDHVRAVHRHLADMILSPLMPNLQTYAALPVWSSSRLPGSVNEYDLNMPSFSLSPTEDMSRIGEALLDLPRLLEVWSDRSPFMWAVQGLAYAPGDVKTIYDETSDLTVSSAAQLFDVTSFAHSASSPKRDKRMSMHTPVSVNTSVTSPGAEKRTSSHAGSHRHTPSVASIATLPARGEQSKLRDEGVSSAADTSTNDVRAVTPQLALQGYLTSISLTLVSHLVSLVLPSIDQLTGPGASQLAADLEYLLTILSALNIASQQREAFDGQSHKDGVLLLIRSLEAWKDVCKIKDQDGRRLRHQVRTGQATRAISLADTLVAGFEGDEDRLRSLLGTQAFDMIARMRGW